MTSSAISGTTSLILSTKSDACSGSVLDFVLEKNKKYYIIDEKISKINRGSGSIHSAAVLYSIVKNKNIKESLKFANKQPFYDVKLKKSEKEL